MIYTNRGQPTLGNLFFSFFFLPRISSRKDRVRSDTMLGASERYFIQRKGLLTLDGVCDVSRLEQGSGGVIKYILCILILRMHDYGERGS